MTEKIENKPESRPPRRHRSPAGRASAHLRPLSLMVAAPALITIAVVAVALISATTGGGAAQPSSPAAKTPRPLANGWYALHPIASAQAELDGCLSILPDDTSNPTLGQDRCSPADPLQRISVDSVAGGSAAFTLKALNFTDKIWCASLVSLENDSRIEMRPCKNGDPRQQFTLAPTDSASRQGPVFRLQPASTRTNGMCVGVKADHPATAHAVHTNCGRTGILGYVLSPVEPPPGSSF